MTRLGVAIRSFLDRSSHVLPSRCSTEKHCPSFLLFIICARPLRLHVAWDAKAAFEIKFDLESRSNYMGVCAPKREAKSMLSLVGARNVYSAHCLWTSWLSSYAGMMESSRTAMIMGQYSRRLVIFLYCAESSFRALDFFVLCSYGM
jgi:hypothetical protein